MPPFVYRSLNTIPPVATDSELEELDNEHPGPVPKTRKAVKAPCVLRRKKTMLNPGYKLALVALHFGSLTDFSNPV